MLLGRDDERERIERLLDAAHDGRSGVLVIRGAPGIGKTALLEYARERADGMTVVRSAGVESEVELEFSGLLDICRPLRGHLGEVPRAHAEALQGALGFGPAEARDRFAIGAGTLALLAAAAEANPLLVLVDDAQWLDRSSQDALRFAARRLVADRACLLFAARLGEAREFDAPTLLTLALDGVSLDAALTLLSANGSRAVAPEVAARLHAETDGTPLALLELSALLSPEQLTGQAPLPEPLPAGPSLERAFAQRAAGLADGTRRALVLVAVATSGRTEVIERALEMLGLDLGSLEQAEDAGLIQLADGRVDFRHNLIRSAIYHAAPPSARRAAHRVLARVLADEPHADERAWHLAAAALGPDEEAAGALEQAAERAIERSGYAVAADALARAARLTVAEEPRLRRLQGAAEASWEAGRTEQAIALLDEGIERAGELPVRSQMLHLRGNIEHLGGRVLEAHDMLESAAGLEEASDPARAVAILADAAEAALFAGRPALGLATARNARDLAPRDGAAHLIADLVLAEALFFSGDADSASALLESANAGVEVDALLRDDPRYLARLAIELGVCGRTAEARQRFERAIELAHARGSVSALPYALEAAAWNNTRAGRWREAYAAATQAKAVALETGQTSLVAECACELAWIDAARGDEAGCRESAAEALALAAERQLDMIRWWADSALALLEIGQGRLEEAVPRLQELALELERHGMHDRDSTPWPELVEAHVRQEQRLEAAQALAAFRAHGVPPGTWGAAVVERCNGLLADESDFESHFLQALALHAKADDPLAHARTLLCFGERLRRSGRKAEARKRLREALTLFDELQAEPWVERVRVELRATGERIRRSRPVLGQELTPQELQVALQVADGKMNKDAAAALFLSPKTIEFHLASVYRKLGIRSRRELIKRFSTGGVEALEPA